MSTTLSKIKRGFSFAGFMDALKSAYDTITSSCCCCGLGIYTISDNPEDTRVRVVGQFWREKSFSPPEHPADTGKEVRGCFGVYTSVGEDKRGAPDSSHEAPGLLNQQASWLLANHDGGEGDASLSEPNVAGGSCVDQPGTSSCAAVEWV